MYPTPLLSFGRLMLEYHHVLCAETSGGADETADARLTQRDYQRALGSGASAEHDPQYVLFLARVSRGGNDQVLRYCRASRPPRELQSSDSPTQITPEVSPASNSTDTAAGVAADGGGGAAVAGCIEGAASRLPRGLLLLSSDPKVKEQRLAPNLPPCPRCGAPRAFEFQVSRTVCIARS